MSFLVQSFPNDLTIYNLASLLRDRVSAELGSMAIGTQRAYVDGLNRFAAWFTAWYPTTPAHVAESIAIDPANTQWWTIIVALLRSSPLVASTVVDTFKTSTTAGNVPG